MPCSHLKYAAEAQRFHGEIVEFYSIIAVPCHTGVVGLFITMVSTFSNSRAHAFEAQARPVHARRSGERGVGHLVSPAGEEELEMGIGRNEAAIDEIVANCNGDLRGALKALLMVNEHLEAEIAQLYAAAAQYGLSERGDNMLH
jgi:hypothetical protein